MSFSSKRITNEKSIKIKFVIVVSLGWYRENGEWKTRGRLWIES
jgi:hypothetical protein